MKVGGGEAGHRQAAVRTAGALLGLVGCPGAGDGAQGLAQARQVPRRRVPPSPRLSVLRVSGAACGHRQVGQL